MVSPRGYGASPGWTGLELSLRDGEDAAYPALHGGRGALRMSTRFTCPNRAAVTSPALPRRGRRRPPKRSAEIRGERTSARSAGTKGAAGTAGAVTVLRPGGGSGAGESDGHMTTDDGEA